MIVSKITEKTEMKEVIVKNENENCSHESDNSSGISISTWARATNTGITQVKGSSSKSENSRVKSEELVDVKTLRSGRLRGNEVDEPPNTRHEVDEPPKIENVNMELLK